MKRLGFAVPGLLFWMFAAGAQAVTLDVCSSGCTYSTIQAAVDAALPGDVIDIAAGTYTGDVWVATPELTIQGAGAGATVVEGLAEAAFIVQEAASPTRIADMTLTSPVSVSCLRNHGAMVALADLVVETCVGVYFSGTYPVGGAIYSTGDLTLRRVTARNNTAPGGLGGALYVGYMFGEVPAVVRIYDSEFSDNQALYGGAVYFEDDVTAYIDGTSFLDNTASDHRPADLAIDGIGGAIYSKGELTLTDSLVHGSFAENNGGGIAVFGSEDTHIANSTISNNSVSVFPGSPSAYTGGGLFVENSGDMTITGSKFLSNSARYGGAIGTNNLGNGGTILLRSSILEANTGWLYGGGAYVAGGGPFTIERSTVTGNEASISLGVGSVSMGGGIASTTGGTVQIRDSTIAGNNSLGLAGGLSVLSAGAISIQNSIVAGNTALDTGPVGSTDDCDWGVVSDDYNLIGTGDGCGIIAQPGDLIGTDAVPLDPMLLPLADNGGPTPSMMPDIGSLAVDSGGLCSDRDQRGFSRPADGGAGIVLCDRGAVEVNGACLGPDAIAGLAPAAGAVVDPGRPFLSWEPADGAVFYIVRLFEFNLPFPILLIASSNLRTSTHWRPSVELVANQDYAWQVIAVSRCGGVTAEPLTVFQVL